MQSYQSKYKDKKEGPIEKVGTFSLGETLKK